MQQVERLVGAAELDVGARSRPSRSPAAPGRAARAARSARARPSAWRSRRARAAGRRSARARAGTGPPSRMSSHSPLRRTSSRSSVAQDLAGLLHVGARVRVDLLAARAPAASPSARSGRRRAPCSRRRSARPCGRGPGTRAASAGRPCGRGGGRGAVGSSPSFTRSGRPVAPGAASRAPGGQHVDGVAGQVRRRPAARRRSSIRANARSVPAGLVRPAGPPPARRRRPSGVELEAGPHPLMSDHERTSTIRLPTRPTAPATARPSSRCARTASATARPSRRAGACGSASCACCCCSSASASSRWSRPSSG